ncbi:hypothetical protein V6Z12_A11G353300 [Gossypium hirsutum]
MLKTQTLCFVYLLQDYASDHPSVRILSVE